MPDVRDVLERAAAEPAGGPDTDAILGRARRLERRRKAVWVGVPVLVLLVGLLAVPGLGPRPSVLLGPGGADRDAFDLPVPGEVSAEFLADNTPVFVVHERDGTVLVVEGLDSRRPWGMGQLVAWCPSSATFEEPRHGSRFTPAGEWLGGPSPEGLASYEVIVEGGQVAVGERRSGAPRGDPGYVLAGPDCEYEGLVLHASVGPARWPEEAAATSASGWTLVAGTVIHTEGDMPRICRAVSGDPPRCPADAPVAQGVEPRRDELRWWSATGSFLARFADGDADDLVMWHDVEIEEGYQVSQERHFGYIQSIEQHDDGSRWVELEQAEWLTGDEANMRARADGVIDLGDTVPNDYYIHRPEQGSTTAFRLSDAAEVFGDIRLNRRGPGLVPMTLQDLLAAEDLSSIPFWVTVERSTWTVVRIEEQYTP